jgi:hypothetical protein
MLPTVVITALKEGFSFPKFAVAIKPFTAAELYCQISTFKKKIKSALLQ